MKIPNPSCRGAAVTAVALALLAATAAPPAAALVATCLELRLPGLEDPEDWELWLVSELRRHPGHEPASADCETTLTIEAFRVDGELVLTAWFPGEVPIRVEVATGAPVRPAAAELLRRVLDSEPLALSDDTDRLVTRLTDRRLNLSEGKMRVGFEVFQTVQRSADHDGPSLMPGVALRMGRELERLLVGVRMGASFTPRSPRPQDPTRAAFLLVVEPELSWYSSASAPTAVYLGTSIGLTVQHHVGQSPDFGEERLTAVGAAVGLRAGVELFRTSRMRVDVFTQATIPLHKTRSPETPLVDAWLPALHAGAGVAF